MQGAKSEAEKEATRAARVAQLLKEMKAQVQVVVSAPSLRFTVSGGENTFFMSPDLVRDKIGHVMEGGCTVLAVAMP